VLAGKAGKVGVKVGLAVVGLNVKLDREYSEAIELMTITASEKTLTWTAGQTVSSSSSSESYLTVGSDFPGMRFVPI
jgi:hypothetical protein